MTMSHILPVNANWKDRFWAKVDIPDNNTQPDVCWEWIGARVKGYGKTDVNGRGVRAHRLAYMLMVGPIPTHLVCDHLCRNRACVNPRHIELVSDLENNRRGTGFAARNARKTHCVNGHEFTKENTAPKWMKNGGIGRRCRICRRACKAEARRRKKLG